VLRVVARYQRGLASGVGATVLLTLSCAASCLASCAIDDRVLTVAPADSGGLDARVDATAGDEGGEGRDSSSVDAADETEASGEGGVEAGDGGPTVPPDAAQCTDAAQCVAPAHGIPSCTASGCGFTCDTYHAPSAASCVAKWTAEMTPSSGLLGIWGSSATDIYAVDYHHVYHSTGTGTWTMSYSVPASGAGSTMEFASIWGDSFHPLNVLVTGGDGTILTTADGGQTWVQINDPTGMGDNYNVAAGNGSSGSSAFLYAFGDYFAKKDGAGWSALSETTRPDGQIFAGFAFNVPYFFVVGDTTGWIYASDTNGQISKSYNTGWAARVGCIWGASTGASNLMAVGGGGGIVSATSCSSSGGPISCNWGVAPQTSNTTQDLVSVYGVANGATAYTYFAVGENGTIVTSSGNGAWAAQTSNTTAYLSGVWAATPTNVFVSAGDGTVMHFNGP
jgi:hypothetical protein